MKVRFKSGITAACFALFISLCTFPCFSQTLKLLSNNHIPQKLLVVLMIRNVDFVEGLIKIVKEIHETDSLPDSESFKLHIVSSFPGEKLLLRLNKADVKKYAEFNKAIYSHDVWMQDIGEFCAVFQNGSWQPAFYDSLRGRGLKRVGPYLSKNWNLTYLANPSKIGKCGDYGGNLDVTPDNIFFHGDTVTEECRNFLLDHGYRNREIVLQTSWLAVGHIDEYMMVIPTHHSPCGYSLVRADPLYALDLVEAASPEDFKALPLIFRPFMKRIQAALKDPEGWSDTSEMKFIELNRAIGELIEANVGKFQQEVRRITGNSSYEVPIVAWPNLFKGEKTGNKLRGCIAYTPGVVNHLVLRDHLVVPDPYFPPFRKTVEARFRSQGNRVHFLSDLSYHDEMGEIHCGTNVLRDPNRVFVTPKAVKAISSLKASFEALHGN